MEPNGLYVHTMLFDADYMYLAMAISMGIALWPLVFLLVYWVASLRAFAKQREIVMPSAFVCGGRRVLFCYGILVLGSVVSVAVLGFGVYTQLVSLRGVRLVLLGVAIYGWIAAAYVVCWYSVSEGGIVLGYLGSRFLYGAEATLRMARARLRRIASGKTRRGEFCGAVAAMVYLRTLIWFFSCCYLGILVLANGVECARWQEESVSLAWRLAIRQAVNDLESGKPLDIPSPGGHEAVEIAGISALHASDSIPRFVWWPDSTEDIEKRIEAVYRYEYASVAWGHTRGEASKE